MGRSIAVVHHEINFKVHSENPLKRVADGFQPVETGLGCERRI
jgi:hypothetical protein